MNLSKCRNVLIVTAVEAEKAAVLNGLNKHDASRFQVETVGAGPVSAAARTANLLTGYSYHAVINMGVAGGFPEKTDIGAAIVASKIIQADLGAESADGFIPIEQLGFGYSELPCIKEKYEYISQLLAEKTDLKVSFGPILTLSTVTGTSDTVLELEARFPDAVGEAMEGFGVATAAQLHGIPCFEIRTISNFVGPRDKGAWRLQEALSSLEKISEHLQEVF